MSSEIVGIVGVVAEAGWVTTGESKPGSVMWGDINISGCLLELMSHLKGWVMWCWTLATSSRGYKHPRWLWRYVSGSPDVPWGSLRIGNELWLDGPIRRVGLTRMERHVNDVNGEGHMRVGGQSTVLFV